MGEPEPTTRLRRRDGMKRIAGLLDELRSFAELREVRPGAFQLGSRPFLHFHYPADGSIVADVRLSARGFSRIDVSDEAGQQELIASIERHLER